ncbi:MAG: 30S ribosomal protein S4 [Planctomycetes bacterium]|nr:30S ribosomal protein S4 [Planctomycetota bacterium]
MANYTGPKVRLSRRVGVPIADIPKHTTKRQLNPPGMHGFRGRRLRDYGVRQNEKQKLRFHYNVLETQFRRYLEEAGSAKGNTGEALLRILEQRLDNVIRRLGWARTVWAARQIVTHGHIMLNGRKTDRPSCQLKVGDVITLRERKRTKEGYKGVGALIRENLESLAGHQVPGWLSFDPSTLTATVIAVPTSDQVPFDVNMNLIIEFYR